MDKHTFYSYLIVGMTFAFGLSAQAQNKVTAPMKDVNQVIDNTLDSLNKAHTARPVAGSSRKGNNPVLFLVGNSTMRTGTLGMVIMDNGDGDIMPAIISIQIKSL